MTASQSPEGPRISRRSLLQGAGALGLSAAGSTWLRPARALAATATNPHSAAQPRLASAGHLVANYMPSQPTGWPPLGLARPRNGVGVTLGGHVASMPFTFQGNPYEISLLAFGQPGNAPDPVYEGEPSDPTIAFKRTLQKAWGAHYSFRYRGGFTGRSKVSVQSYSVLAIEPTATQPHLSYGGDLFIAYEPDPTSTDPPITDDLQWIQITHSLGRTFVDGDVLGRANPFNFGSGLTSVDGKQACSFYDGPEEAIAVKRPTTLEDQRMFETFLAKDTGRKDHAGKGIVDIYGGIKWGWQVQPVQPS
jgi:hypothetical protein